MVVVILRIWLGRYMSDVGNVLDLFLFFLPCLMLCEILVPWPGAWLLQNTERKKTRCVTLGDPKGLRKTDRTHRFQPSVRDGSLVLQWKVVQGLPGVPGEEYLGVNRQEGGAGAGRGQTGPSPGLAAAFQPWQCGDESSSTSRCCEDQLQKSFFPFYGWANWKSGWVGCSSQIQLITSWASFHPLQFLLKS